MAPSDPEPAPKREPAPPAKPGPEPGAEPGAERRAHHPDPAQAQADQPAPALRPAPEVEPELARPSEAEREAQFPPKLHLAPELDTAPELDPAPELEPAREFDRAPELDLAPELEPAREFHLAPQLEPASALPASESAADGAEPAAPRPRVSQGRWVWPVFLCVCAALLGLAVGVGAALRGRSLGPGSGATVSRPTFVIGASVSPVPSRAPSPVVAGPASTAAAAEYVDEPGDTLRSIAQHIYGDADQWPRIYDANRDLIGPDPDALQAGMRLRTP